MAGPCATVFIAKNAAADAESVVRQIIEAVSEAVEGEDFWVASTIPIGGVFAGTGRPFFWTLEFVDRSDPESATSPEEFDQIEGFAGFAPEVEIGFCAMCNADEDHRILGEIVLACAERLAGAIDFDGELPRLSDDERRQIGGRSTRVEVKENDRTMGSIIGNADFLKAWLSHGHFRMVK